MKNTAKRIVSAGEKFNMLTVLGEGKGIIEPGGQRIRTFICKCECGRETEVRMSCLGRYVSCGCYRKHNTIKRNTTHGLYHTRLHGIWAGMLTRCKNPHRKTYPHYGGRGITVCKEWENDFKAFYDWANKNGYSDNLTIDRIDVNRNYEPSNCRWASYEVQNNNRHKLPGEHEITLRGETRNVGEWCKILGLPRSTVFNRMNRGWDFERVFFAPVQIHKKHTS